MNPQNRLRWSRTGLFLLVVAPPVWGQPPAVSFVSAAADASCNYEHGFLGLESTDWQRPEYERRFSGGIAAGDYDRDGWVDLYAVRGDIGPAVLLRNLGDGTFEEVAAAAGVAITGNLSGPAFGDVDGDGWLDLLVNGVDGASTRLFRNLTDGSFQEITATAGLDINPVRNSVSAAFGDFDVDGDLDILQTRWQYISEQCTAPCAGHLWENDGTGSFTDVGVLSGVVYTDKDHTFAPNFADLDSDGLPDLLLASDFGTSRVYLNQGGGMFADVSDPAVLTDENGMGAAVGDYDNDGDLDWFVSSIFDPGPGAKRSGNRLYRNRGDGTFDEVSVAAGVREGFWGWGSCFADFNNDGHLDIFHVNGWRSGHPWFDFWANPSRLFISNGDGTFDERAAEYGLTDSGQGRGVACFDYDRDGNVDVFVANNGQNAALYRNLGNPDTNFLTLRLRRTGGETSVGARVYLTAGATAQMREVRAGNNYVSQQPQEVHFGLAGESVVETLTVDWPDGVSETWTQVAANRFLLAAAEGLCAPTLDLTAHTVSAEEAHSSCQVLSASDVLVEAAGVLSLSAGETIELGDGFSVANDGELVLDLDPNLTSIRP